MIQEERMKYVVITQNQVELDKPTETFLLSALEGLHRECDSIHSCRVHLRGADSTGGKPKPFCVTLSLSAGERHINVRSYEPTNNALTARDAIRAAIEQAADELRELKANNDCVTCSHAGDHRDLLHTARAA
jgi:hypothetical protein